MDAVHGSTTEKTFCSRMRRAISCEYCAPKSRTTMDWVSTIYSARGRQQCKAAREVRARVPRDCHVPLIRSPRMSGAPCEAEPRDLWFCRTCADFPVASEQQVPPL